MEERKLAEGLKSATNQHLSHAKDFLADSPKHLATAKDFLSSVKRKLTPDELQRTIDLNNYTLETFSHIRSLLSHQLDHSNLSAIDQAFCRQVVEAIPVPPSPSAAARPTPSYDFSYPDDHRERLASEAASKKIMVRDSDFAMAERGDLERALYIMMAILVDKRHHHIAEPAGSVDDVMLGLPVSQST